MKKAEKATIEQRAEMAKAGLISPYWVLHKINEKKEALEFIDLMGYKKGWIHMNKHRFNCLQNE
jgi:hypothetical protein